MNTGPNPENPTVEEQLLNAHLDRISSGAQAKQQRQRAQRHFV